jgi:hypothetical protein
MICSIASCQATSFAVSAARTSALGEVSYLALDFSSDSEAEGNARSKNGSADQEPKATRDRVDLVHL